MQKLRQNQNDVRTAFEVVMKDLKREDKSLLEAIIVKEETAAQCRLCKTTTVTLKPSHTHFGMSLPKPTTIQSRCEEIFKSKITTRRCEACNKPTKSLTTRVMRTTTPFLIVSVDHKECSFENFTANTKITVCDRSYKLKSAVEYLGDGSEGHYVSWVRNLDSSWSKISDLEVEEPVEDVDFSAKMISLMVLEVIED